MAAELVDLKISKKEAKDREKGLVGPGGQPDPYPWGLSMHFDKPTLEKLGIKDLPQVGGEMHMECICKVTSSNQSARQGEEENSSIGVQVIMAKVTLEESAKDEAAEDESPKSEAAEDKKAGSLMAKYKG